MDLSSLLSLLGGGAAQNPLLSLLPMLLGNTQAAQNAPQKNQQEKDMLLPLLSGLLSGGMPDLSSLSSLFPASAPPQTHHLPAAPLDPVAHIADHEILYSLGKYFARENHFSE